MTAIRKIPASQLVMPELVPGIHVPYSASARKTWMAGSSPAMTAMRISRRYAGS
jgi:hypothetical protein